ncbi:precorrin-6y C5,15-methyltransferase (decarboxylating) subunit CbiE [Antrihabitans sp. YC2-6]|uniref:precorrin-6y C5,15-methyltransferase (decarboxylating) subunit CbiE n=1 Tax=Antrihabitans sp. YC2-6 TaxID=2799498 RepID=UPI0018F42281|nr:precorrin-6y C5,15-methyltransferase (decarboxylating) subunit CbiE [Antrihabitans sp. YC2-6]MBJ8345579.1 precorrin-6y C5,15-methyltransferase (decarboxylating) subunit CbiE [Antrihabitans sp. YC2-6]
MTDRVTVVGIGADGWEGLSPKAARVLLECDVILGSGRQLALLDAGVTAQRVPWPTPLLPALQGLLESFADVRLCVLASGDPMFHGIGVTLARLLGADRLRVLPQASSTSLACARLGWPVAQTPTVSVVNRPVETVLAAVHVGAKLIVLSQDGQTPGVLAQVLRDNGFGDSRLTVLEQLDGPGERSYSASAREWPTQPSDPLNVVAVECVADTGMHRLSRGPGLPDEAFGGDGQLTKREVRALTLSALAPVPGELLWDVGGGSGSIGIEWMRSHPSCRAIAFEQSPTRRAQIAVNASTLGVPGLVVLPTAPAAFDDAVPPDAVFVGGGLTEPGLLQACWEHLRAGGRLVANAVTVESEALLVNWSAAHGGTLRRFQVYRAEPLGRMTSWRPQLPITQLVAQR